MNTYYLYQLNTSIEQRSLVSQYGLEGMVWGSAYLDLINGAKNNLAANVVTAFSFNLYKNTQSFVIDPSNITESEILESISEDSAFNPAFIEVHISHPNSKPVCVGDLLLNPDTYQLWIMTLRGWEALHTIKHRAIVDFVLMKISPMSHHIDEPAEFMEILQNAISFEQLGGRDHVLQ